MTWDYILGILNNTLLNINAMVCFLIMLRLMFFRRNGSRFRPGMAWVAYAIILASGFIAFSTWLQYYTSVHPAELILNITVCVAIWQANGNIARIAVRK